MNKRLIYLFWGLILIAGGAYALARTAGFEITQDPTVWAFIFGGISVFSLIFYFADGVKNWGWLFPVGIFGGLAITSGLVARGVDDPAMAAPLFIGIGLPFIVAFFHGPGTQLVGANPRRCHGVPDPGFIRRGSRGR